MTKAKSDLAKWHGRGDASRARILEVARSLFVRQGFAATPVSQIARESKLTIPPVYYHFGSKLGLFKAVIEEAGSRISDDLEGLSRMPLREGLAALVERAVKNIDAHIAGLRLRLLVSFQQDEDAKTLQDMMRERREQSVAVISEFCLGMLDAKDPWRVPRSKLIAELYLAGLQHLCLDLMSEDVAPPMLSTKKRLLVDSLVQIGELSDFKREM